VAAEPKGSEVIEIRAADDTNADAAIAKESAVKAAKRVVLQEERAVNAWLHGDLEHTSDEELLRFVEPGSLDQVKETLQATRNDLKNNGGVFTGNTSAQNLTVTDVSSVEYSDGSSYPYGYMRVRFCSDWTQVHTPDGKRAVTGPEAQITVEAVVTRTQDGRYLYSGGRKLGNGCAAS
jgi:methyl coenzyme M reductase, gamma subunit